MINKCEFIGRLGQEPEMKYAPSGTAFCNISVACTEKWKDKQTQEQKEHTEWVRCVASGRLAEVCGEYLRKGALVYVSGKMNTRKWQDQSGQDRYSTEIRINEMKMLDSKQQGQQQPQQGGWGNQQNPSQGNRGNHQQNNGNNGVQQSGGNNNPAGGMQPQQKNMNQPTYNEPPMDFDDSIPF